MICISAANSHFLHKKTNRINFNVHPHHSSCKNRLKLDHQLHLAPSFLASGPLHPACQFCPRSFQQPRQWWRTTCTIGGAKLVFSSLILQSCAFICSFMCQILAHGYILYLYNCILKGINVSMIGRFPKTSALSTSFGFGSIHGWLDSVRSKKSINVKSLKHYYYMGILLDADVANVKLPAATPSVWDDSVLSTRSPVIPTPTVSNYRNKQPLNKTDLLSPKISFPIPAILFQTPAILVVAFLSWPFQSQSPRNIFLCSEPNFETVREFVGFPDFQPSV